MERLAEPCACATSPYNSPNTNANTTNSRPHHKQTLNTNTSSSSSKLQDLAPASPARPPNRAGQLNTTMTPLLLLVGALLVLLTAAPPCQTFNLDTSSPVVHSGPAGSYFGYSVAQHRDGGVFWLLVGAPKATTSQARVREGGAMYRCALGGPGACQQISFDPNGSRQVQLRNDSRPIEDKSHQMFAASLASATENGSIVVCAPKYVYHSINLRRRDPVGTCWLSRGSFSGFLEYSPCRLEDQWGHHHLGSCQAGFSTAITKDGSKLFLGAPGSHVWQGQVFGYNLRSDLQRATSAENPHDEDDSYLGYSLALGRFSATSGAQDELAIGVPRGHDLQGLVMLVDRELRSLRNLTGEQVGSYFGYSLAAGDLNNDGIDDLLIGAPLFYNHTVKEGHFERGRVYLALSGAGGRRELAIVGKLDGSRNGARFGHSIALAADLNRDGLVDVVVGAPFDGPDGRGAVHIYLGRRSSSAPLGPEPDQVVLASELHRSLRTLGFALSAGLDVDSNGYPDVLVGAYGSDQAVLLRARPVVNVTSSLAFSPDHLNLDERTCLLANGSQSVACLSITYCLRYTGHNLEPRLPFTVDLKLDSERHHKDQPRLFLLQDPSKSEERLQTSLARDVNQCRTFKAYAPRQVRDKLTPLKVELDYALADSYTPTGAANSPDPPLRPVLAKTPANQPKLARAASIQKNCGPNNLCVPDLGVQVAASSERFLLGANQPLVLDVTVTNQGQDAFESMFYLTMPPSLDFIKVNKSRQDLPDCFGLRQDPAGANLLACDLGNPQPRGDSIRFQVILEPSRLVEGATSDLSFVAKVNSSNAELDDAHREDNELPFSVLVRVEANLVLSGSSQPPLLVHNASQHLQRQQEHLLLERPRLLELDMGPEVQHVYQIQNRGPSSVNDLALTVLWPSMNSRGQHLLYLVDEPQTSANVRCKPPPDKAINPLQLRYVPPAAPPTQQRSLTKRQVTPLLPAPQNASTTVDQSLLEQLNPCGPTQCTRFECNVLNLASGELASIRIRSRLSLDTVSQLELAEFDISSKLVAQIKSLPYNASTRLLPPYVLKVETQVRTTGVSVASLLPWWLIVLAILLGVALFILLACFLNYLGFFARKRPPTRGPEREPLTPTNWKDYHFTPGDTAL